MRDTTERASVTTDSGRSRALAQDGYVALGTRLLRHNQSPTLVQRADTRALGEALTDLANQRTDAERQRRQWTPRQTICRNVGSMLSCTTYWGVPGSATHWM
jgi:hypothetical protein